MEGRGEGENEGHGSTAGPASSALLSSTGGAAPASRLADSAGGKLTLLSAPAAFDEVDDLPSLLKTAGCCAPYCAPPPCAGPRSAKPVFYVLVLTFFGFAQSMTIAGLFGLAVSSIQRQFGFTSTAMGVIAAGYDASSGIFGLLLANMAHRAHKPRILAFCAILFGLGCIMYALPAFLAPTYDPEGSKGIELCEENRPAAICAVKPQAGLYLMFLAAHLIMGFATAPLYTIALTFIDDNAKPEKVSVYMGSFFSSNALGPATGYLLGGYFLTLFVDRSVTPRIDQKSPAWVGAWWMGYLLSGCLAIVAGCHFLLIPRQLPGMSWVRKLRRTDPLHLHDTGDLQAPLAGDAVDSHSKQRTTASDAANSSGPASPSASASAGQQPRRSPSASSLQPEAPLLSPRQKRTQWLRNLWQDLWALMCNPAFMGVSLGNYSDAFMISGVGNFLPAFVQTQFHLTSADASFLCGVSIILGVGLGMFGGGIIPRCMKWRPRQLAVFMVICSFLSVCFFAAFFVQCQSLRLAGINVGYPASVPQPPQNASAWTGCSASCGCVSKAYTPVCDTSSGVTYYSPCAAGCLADLPGSIHHYANCTCAGAAPGPTLEDGKCRAGCNSLGLFLFLVFVALLCMFLNGVPITMVHLRCVEDRLRSLALAFAAFQSRLLGATIAPVITGAILDNACVLWETTCNGSRGACLEYNNHTMAVGLFISSLVVKMAGTIGYGIAAWKFPKHRDLPFELSKKYEVRPDGSTEALEGHDGADQDDDHVPLYAFEGGAAAGYDDFDDNTSSSFA